MSASRARITITGDSSKLRRGLRRAAKLLNLVAAGDEDVRIGVQPPEPRAPGERRDGDTFDGDTTDGGW